MADLNLEPLSSLSGFGLCPGASVLGCEALCGVCVHVRLWILLAAGGQYRTFRGPGQAGRVLS